MINIFLTFALISLQVPKCSTLLKAASLGRRWAYEDIRQLELKRPLTDEEEKILLHEEVEFQRRVLRIIGQVKRRLRQ